MRILTREARRAVQAVIDASRARLEAIPGFVAAEPGFPIIDGAVHRTPAIIVFVAHKKPPTHLLDEDKAPRQIGAYRVAVMQADPVQQLAVVPGNEAVIESMALAANELTYEPIDGNPIDALFDVATPMLCHAGPDAGWPVLRPFIEATERTLTVAMYDFNADYIAKTFIDTVRGNDLKAVLTWDDSMTDEETGIRADLKARLGDSLDGWIVKCGAGRRFDSAYHEKVAVRDSSAFWLSSGNWSKRSQPDIDPIGTPQSARGMFSKGNREWHIIVEDEPLAKLFERYILRDRDGSKQEAEEGEPGVALGAREDARFPDLFVPIEALTAGIELAGPVVPVAPKALPTQARPVSVRPLLSPDNYYERILELVGSATRSLYLQFSYITYSEDAQDGKFRDLLAKLAALTNKPSMDVRIIMGSSGSANRIRKLVEKGFNPAAFRSQASIHNKGIIVDGETVLVSSTNWSGDGVLRNRDAGLIIKDAEIAGYYQDIFLDDWESRATARVEDDPPVLVAAEGAPTPPGMVRMAWRDYFD